MNQYNSNLQWCSMLENSVENEDCDTSEIEFLRKGSTKKLKRVNSQEYLSLHNRKHSSMYRNERSFDQGGFSESQEDEDDTNFAVQCEIQRFIK